MFKSSAEYKRVTDATLTVGYIWECIVQSNLHVHALGL